jgi:hypothetical protein
MINNVNLYASPSPVLTQNTYAGEFAGKYIAAALFSSPTIDKELISVLPNVRYKEVIQKLDFADLIANATCDFGSSPTSSMAISERVITTEEFQVNLQLCKKQLRQTWEALAMGPSVLNDTIPASFSDFVIGYVAENVAQQNEINIWRGVNATAGQFDGLVTLMCTDSGSAGAPTFISASAVTSASVISTLQTIVDAIPTAVYGKEDLYIYAPANVIKAYASALGTANYQFGSYVGGKPLDYLGIPVAYAPGLASSTLVAAQKSNLFFGCSIKSDLNEVRVLDMSDLDGSQNVRFVMRYASGVQYGVGSDIVVYKNC